uniref:Uncharacterized protein n=1 Tax=Clostridium botulinum TaxID=1491 RepID=A0A126JIA6_CLOBO|nr:hypothetical protein [Clostridium botulinum]ALT05912.1 hypothetical protein [Clostridium botulinum]
MYVSSVPYAVLTLLIIRCLLLNLAISFLDIFILSEIINIFSPSCSKLFVFILTLNLNLHTYIN